MSQLLILNAEEFNNNFDEFIKIIKPKYPNGIHKLKLNFWIETQGEYILNKNLFIQLVDYPNYIFMVTCYSHGNFENNTPENSLFTTLDEFQFGIKIYPNNLIIIDIDDCKL